MRTFIFTFFFILMLSAVSFMSCDKVEEPYMNVATVVDTVICPLPQFDTFTPTRKVLLEEFTGHKCPNCPGASALAAQLEDQYQGQLVLKAIHSGYFAIPDNDGLFTTDFTTDAGDAIASNFGIVLNPVGMVNRMPYNGNVVLNPGDWVSAIDDIINQPPQIYIQLQAIEAADGEGDICIHAKTHFLETLNGNYYLVITITENNITAAQKTNDPNYPDGEIPDYSHNHVLRHAVNGPWGVEISAGNVEAGTTFINSYQISPKDAWDIANCKIVAYVYNCSEEIVQVQEIDLMP